MSYQHPRKNTDDLLALVEEGYLDPLTVLKSALIWMSDQEVKEFALANEFFHEQDDDLDDDQ